MPERQTQLDLRLVLPQAVDDGEECVSRLVSVLETRQGVTSVHVVRPWDHGPSHDGFLLCLHYDPERLSLAQVQQLVRWAGAATEARFGHLVLPFRMIGSEDEGRRIEEGLRSLDGVTAASVNFAGQVVRVEYDRSKVDEPAILSKLKALDLRPPTVPKKPSEATGWLRRNRELVWSLASGVLLVSAWLVERFTVHTGSLANLMYGGAYLFGAWDTLGHFLKDLTRGRVRFDIDLLMLVAAAGAAILGEWAEGALLLFLFSLGHALEHYALGRARHAIEALSELAPDVARVQGPDGTETEKAIDQVRPGDLVVVRPAERIPVDGEVASGRSAVNQAPITGESMPVPKSPGERVFAGSVNGDGGLLIKVTAAIGDRTLDRVVRLVEEAETQKAPTQQFTDRFERVFVPAVLIADFFLIVLPPTLGVWTWSESFYRGMALLVAASPCALALGTPAAVLAGIAQAARNGVLIKGGAHLESLGTIRALALDKTGTITSGRPDVTDLLPAAGVDETELLGTAAAVERRSQHPLAQAIVRAANQRGLPMPEAGDLESLTGRGVRARVGNVLVEIGRPFMFEEAGIEIPVFVRESVAGLETAGRSTVVVYRRSLDSNGSPVAGPLGQWVGVIGIADSPRTNVSQTLVRLRQAGIRRLVMLSGDNRGVANAVGRAVGIDEVRAGLLPEEKVTAIRELAGQGPVAMVGDGVNDAPALAHATVGIAMGGAGTAAALETADIALMGDDLSRLPFLIRLSLQARRIIRQNLYVSLGVVGILVLATTTGFLGIAPAVAIHEGSTLVVIANALRLLTVASQGEG